MTDLLLKNTTEMGYDEEGMGTRGGPVQGSTAHHFSQEQSGKMGNSLKS